MVGDADREVIPVRALTPAPAGNTMSQRWMAMVEEKWLQAILNPAAFDQNNRLRFLEILKSVTGEYLALEKRLVPEYDQAIERLGGA
jgi:hypothetical protein